MTARMRGAISTALPSKRQLPSKHHTTTMQLPVLARWLVHLPCSCQEWARTGSKRRTKPASSRPSLHTGNYFLLHLGQMLIHIHIRIHVRIHIHTHTYIYLSLSIYIYIHMYMCIYFHLYLRTGLGRRVYLFLAQPPRLSWNIYYTKSTAWIIP